MAKKSKSKSGQRGSKDLWIDAAYAVLIESGIDAVKVMPLADSLGMSRTSFYWHFQDREELLAALIEKWRQKNTGNLIAQTKAYAESIAEAMLNIFDCWVEPELFDSKLDFAIRNWAQQSAHLKEIVAKVDGERIDAIRAMFMRFDFDESEANPRAYTVYYTQIGYISLMVEEPVTLRLKNMPDYVEIFTGLLPSKSEFARFSARHTTPE